MKESEFFSKSISEIVRPAVTPTTGRTRGIRFHDKHYYDAAVFSATATYAGKTFAGAAGFLNT